MNKTIMEKEKTKIKISGTYGDKVKLHLDGYVFTKYGETYKVKSIDQEKGYVYLYGCGDGGYDYSRISGSCKVSEKSDREYIEILEGMFKRLKIKKGSIIKFKFDENAPIETFNVSEIIYPTLKDTDYVPKIILKNINTLEEFNVIINDFDNFSHECLKSVEYTPYTLEEKLRNLLDDSTDFNGSIKDKNKYIQNLLEIINDDKNNTTIFKR